MRLAVKAKAFLKGVLHKHGDFYMHEAKLKRVITLPHLILYGMGTMIGAGIYVLLGIIAGHANFYTPFSFLIAGLVGLLTAFSYADLSHHFPDSAGAAIYVRHGFKNDLLSKVVGYLVILSGIVSCGALAKGFSGYAQELVEINYNFLVFAFIFTLGFISCWRIHFSMWIISIISIVEILGLLFVVAVLLPDFDYKIIFNKTLSIPSGADLLGLASAALLAFYAFIGFEDMVNVVEEVKVNTMRKGIIYAFFFTCIIYFLIAIVSTASVDMSMLTKKSAPLVEMLSGHTPLAGKLISVVSVIATINGGLIQIILSSRILYGMGRKNLGISLFSKINPITHTPLYGVLFTVFLIIIFSYFFPIEQLAKITSVAVLFVFCLVNLSLVILIRKKIIPRKRSRHILMPLSALITCLILLVTQLYIELDKAFNLYITG
jgi:amino acid transporter